MEDVENHATCARAPGVDLGDLEWVDPKDVEISGDADAVFKEDSLFGELRSLGCMADQGQRLGCCSTLRLITLRVPSGSRVLVRFGGGELT